MNHKKVDGTELVGWLRGQQSTLPLGHAARPEYEKIVIHVVTMMREEESDD